MYRTCFSFQPSGHKYKALHDLPGGPIVRLYCPRCGRVIPADQRYNTDAWASVDLPLEVESEVGGPLEQVH